MQQDLAIDVQKILSFPTQTRRVRLYNKSPKDEDERNKKFQQSKQEVRVSDDKWTIQNQPHLLT